MPVSDKPVPVTGAPISAGWGADVHMLGYRGSDTATGSVTLASAGTDYAGLATVTFTLTKQRRVKITTSVKFQAAAQGRFLNFAAYNPGASAAIGSEVDDGLAANVSLDTTGAAGAQTGVNVADFLLDAGTYTAYAAVQRAAGGTNADTAFAFYTLVEDIGAS